MSQLDTILKKIKKLEDKAVAIQQGITALEIIVDKHNLLTRIENDCDGQWKRYTFVRWDVGNHHNPLAYAVDELLADQMIELVKYEHGIQFLTITDKGKQYRQELEQPEPANENQ